MMTDADFIREVQSCERTLYRVSRTILSSDGLLRRCSGGLNPRMEASKRCKSEFFQNMAGAYFDQ